MVQRIVAPPLELRLQNRYFTLVTSHINTPSPLAAGTGNLPGVAGPLAATQGAWRFLNNERVTLPALVEPLREAGHQAAAAVDAPFLLLVHDWCKLGITAGRNDQPQLTHRTDIGYELTTALLVSPDNGQPLAPLEIHLRTRKGTLSTRDPGPGEVPHLEQVLPTMRAAAGWNFERPFVHVIDREADSVDHYRQWHAAGHLFLIRGDDRRVQYEDESILLSQLSLKLGRKRKFRAAGEVLYRGRPVELRVAEADVVLDRPAKKNVQDERYDKPGEPLPLRLIVAQVRNTSGRKLAQWLLLSNVPAELADADKLAHCYYWRWRIESFFKLLKSHGCQLEQWKQRTGEAVARRLLIASMACIVVWQLQAEESPAATELKDVLVRLSGRQTRRDRPHTAPALLCGLFLLLTMLETLEQYDPAELRQLASVLPAFHNTG